MKTKRMLIALALALLVSVLCTWLVARKLTKPSTRRNIRTPCMRHRRAGCRRAKF